MHDRKNRAWIHADLIVCLTGPLTSFVTACSGAESGEKIVVR